MISSLLLVLVILIYMYNINDEVDIHTYKYNKYVPDDVVHQGGDERRGATAVAA